MRLRVSATWPWSSDATVIEFPSADRLAVHYLGRSLRRCGGKVRIERFCGYGTHQWEKLMSCAECGDGVCTRIELPESLASAEKPLCADCLVDWREDQGFDEPECQCPGEDEAGVCHCPACRGAA